MTDFEKFQEAALKNLRKAAQEGSVDHLWQHNRVLAEVLSGWMEIHQSFEALGDIETYIRRSRYAKDGVSQSRQLRYHAENYLNEAYILKSRLKAYFVRLRKSYRRTLTARQAGVVNEMTASVTSAFEAITIPRGKHE